MDILLYLGITTAILIILIVGSFKLGYKSGTEDGYKKARQQTLRERINIETFLKGLPDKSHVSLRHEGRDRGGMSTFLVKVYSDRGQLLYQDLVTHQNSGPRRKFENGSYTVIKDLFQGEGYSLVPWDKSAEAHWRSGQQ